MRSTLVATFIIFGIKAIPFGFKFYPGNNPYEPLMDGDECDGNVTEDVRQEFLDAHNFHRSRVARGLYVAKDKILPPASDMIQLRWSCELEKAAQEWADRCEWKHDVPLPLHSESLWRIWGPESYLQRFRIGVNASARWAREFEELGMQAEFHKIGHAMLMTYSDQFLMGCGYAKCSGPVYNHLFAVCRYFSNGRRHQGRLYAEGDPISSCPSGYSGNNDTALCEAEDLLPLTTQLPFLPKRPTVEEDPFVIFACKFILYAWVQRRLESLSGGCNFCLVLCAI